MRYYNVLKLCVGLVCITCIVVILKHFPDKEPAFLSHARKVTKRDEVPDSLKGLIISKEELKGRHSDYLPVECENQELQINKNINNTFGFVGPFNYLPNYKNPCWLAGDNHTLYCVPFFYVAGCPKSGTSDLHHKLSQHPDIITGISKEIRWFDWYRFNDPAKFRFDAFLNFYAKATNQIQSFVHRKHYHYKVIVDGSPHTAFRNSYWQLIPENKGCPEPTVTAISQVHHLWPQTKILLILRNPVNRLFSAYIYNYNETGASRTAAEFHEWTVIALEKWKGCLRAHTFRFCMYSEEMRILCGGALPFGMYSRYLLDALRVFPRDQIYVIQTEQWAKDTESIMRKVIQFLELDPLPDKYLKVIASKKKRNAGDGYNKCGPMWKKTSQLLTEFYAPFNRELADILGDSKFLWIDPK